jgi:small-conductance mechanosensitive channel
MTFMQDHQTTSIGAVVARVFWMMLGPLMLLVMAFTIAKNGNGWLSGVSIGYLGVLAATILARWLEFRDGAALTSDGQPMTTQLLRRFVVLAAVVGLAVWVVANVLGIFVFSP